VTAYDALNQSEKSLKFRAELERSSTLTVMGKK
jgi:hypothetical protein